MKRKRQNLIMRIIGERDIETQADLMEALEKEGVMSTQATLSRDIKELMLVKRMGDSGKYRYTISGKTSYVNHEEKLKKIFKESVVSCEVANSIIVIKTLPGLANAASAAIDAVSFDGLYGTVAGDDTLFVAMHDKETALKVCRHIREYF